MVECREAMSGHQKVDVKRHDLNGSTSWERLPEVGAGRGYRKEARRLAGAMMASLWALSVFLIQLREFVDFEPFDLRLTVLSMAVLLAVGLTATTIVYLIIERLERFPLWVPVIAILVLGYIGGRYFFETYAFFFSPFYPSQPADSTAQYYSFVFWGHFFVAWGAICLAILHSRRARDEQRLKANAEAVTHRSRMLALRYQLNPHFLFNTFNSVAALVLDGKNEAAERMITRLSAFLRRGLGESPLEEITLKQEVEHQLDYLSIEAERFSDRLEVDIDLPDQMGGALVPGFILQPLIENAIKHGVSPTSDKITISIAAEQQDDALLLTVSEDSKERTGSSTSGHGVGLQNVRQRLAERYGQLASFHSGRIAGGGFETRLKLPLRMGEKSSEGEVV